MKMSVCEYLEKICDFFDPEKAGNRRLVLVYKIHDSGENDGTWTIHIEGGKCELRQGEEADYNVKMLMTAETYERIVTGKLPLGYLSYVNGDVRYFGEMLGYEEMQTFLTIPENEGIIAL